MREWSTLSSMYTAYLQTQLQAKSLNGPAEGLYEPQRYILQLGGKRLRPTLVLLSTEACGGSVEEALPAAHAVELFHNFSLIHDDIMDAAPLRRGQATVHHRWDTNTAILSGDALLVLAYQSLQLLPPDAALRCTPVFSKAALEVCEGQQWDMEFEKRWDVSETEYLRMIQNKTSVLLGCSLQMGALVAGASEQKATALYRFAHLLGTSFQIHDDLLDAFGDPDLVGKQAGGDLQSNKKTLLMIRLLAQKGPMVQPWLSFAGPSQEKIEALKRMMEETGVRASVEEMRALYYRQALEALAEANVDDTQLKVFAQALWDRKF